MRVTAVVLRDFRSYADAELRLGEGLTVLHGRNGAGKTNLLEALFVGCTARSFRTGSQRESIRFGRPAARVELRFDAADGGHLIAVGLSGADGRRVRVDGAAFDRVDDAPARPLASVFSPDRLELVKGGPALRRAHLDQVVAALWPSRADIRREYARSLAQRNALLSRLRAGVGGRDALAAWDRQLACAGLALMATRREAVQVLAERFGETAESLGLEGDPRVAYRPRSRATDEGDLAAELGERLDSDLERGFTGHGPHRDELSFSHDGRELRTYGSQGQQRLALLALLLAERAAIADARGFTPLMLLDDAMSELDGVRRERLVDHLAASGGQSVIATTDAGHVPRARSADSASVAVPEDVVVEPPTAAAA